MPSPKRTLTSPVLKFDVTSDSINRSIKRDSSHCMIADALAAAVPQAAYISVDLATIRFTDLNAGRRYIYLTPRLAQEALLNFDQGIEPEPFFLRLAGAHVIPTGNGRKGKRWLDGDDPEKPYVCPEPDCGRGFPSQRSVATHQGKKHNGGARLVAKNTGTGGVPPERHGGQSPPIGPLQGGSPKVRRPDRDGNDGAGSGNRPGRRREFGLRAMVR